MLKVMPCHFDFDDKDVSTVSVWINLPGLPLKFWNTSALGKIVSKVGKHISTDKVAASRGWLSYARALVELDASIELVQMVKIRLPNGILREKEILFEHEPKFCGSCKVFGHSNLGCNYNKKAVDDKGKSINRETSNTSIPAAQEENVQAGKNWTASNSTKIASQFSMKAVKWKIWGADSTSNVRGADSKKSSNEKLKGKVDEQRKVGTKIDKKKGISLASKS
ncbi:uncharacterized protein LOC111365714 [Olea europaea var. sylvestris]|uniref:uncharacterized protein LOC111365714 n=1 Tax=Olea europaea var. sylvestris TaxID=158386 RepID=UPI000C1CEFBD|nr:uncharacterized protein LOC111365714 [Olea europaea var. sylvestris]